MTDAHIPLSLQNQATDHSIFKHSLWEQISFSQLFLKEQVACRAIRRFCFNGIRFLSPIEATIRDLNTVEVRVECVCRIIGMLGVWPVILAAVDADLGVRLRLRAPETVAVAVVDLRTIKPERKAVVSGNGLPMFDGGVEHQANVVAGVCTERC